MSIEIAKQLEIGDVFYETAYGITLTLETITKPERSETGQWTWEAMVVDSTASDDKVDYEVDYMITEGYAHYGPNIHL